MRILFLGTPAFAIPTLSALVQAGHKILAVITQEDKPAGRGQELTPPAAKVWALEHGVSVYQPTNLKDPAFLEAMKALSPEAIVSASYGKIIPETLLKIPPYGCLNVHASLLPKYRGAAPINWVLFNGERVTGITIMETIKELDAGPMILQKELPIDPQDNAGTLHDKLASLGAVLIVEALRLTLKGKAQKIPQDPGQVSCAPKLKKEDGHINWNDSAEKIHNLVRGLTPWPSAYTFIHGLRTKIWETKIGQERELPKGKPGMILGFKDNFGMMVSCRDRGLWILKLQPEGKRIMTVDEYLRGHRTFMGDRLG
jgi:methionyl-tRNA formyltransferase